jgi:hypothetical protein
MVEIDVAMMMSASVEAFQGRPCDSPTCGVLRFGLLGSAVLGLGTDPRAVSPDQPSNLSQEPRPSGAAFGRRDCHPRVQPSTLPLCLPAGIASGSEASDAFGDLASACPAEDGLALSRARSRAFEGDPDRVISWSGAAGVVDEETEPACVDAEDAG